MNNTIKTFSLAAAFVALAGLTPVSASAQCCEQGMNGHEHHHHFKMMEKGLGLSSQQKQDIRNVFTKSQAQKESLMQQLKKERHELGALIHGDSVNDAAIRSQSAKVASVEADLAILRAHTMQQFRALLTPEQGKKLKEIREKHERGGERRHHRLENHCKQDN